MCNKSQGFTIMTRTTNINTNAGANTLPRLAQTCIAAFIALLSASAVTAQDEAVLADEPADPAAEQAEGGACTAQVGLGELSLSGSSGTTTSTPTESNMDTASSGAEMPGSESASTSAPSYSGSDAGGFISLAGGSPASATECAAAGSELASTEDLSTSPAGPSATETSSTAVAEPPAEAPPAVARAEVMPVAEVAPPPVKQDAPVKKKKEPAAPRRESSSKETSKVWWPAPESGRLNLRFAGEAAFGQAIALLFDAPFADASSADAHVQVTNRAGTVLKGKWQVVKSNPQMLALKAAPGTYTIRIGGELVASNGLRFKQNAEGKVLVR